MPPGGKPDSTFYHSRWSVTCPKKFFRKQLELAANDVLIALEHTCSREEALKVAKAVLEGYGHIYVEKPNRKPMRIYQFPGGEPRIGLRRKKRERLHFTH